MTIDQSNNFEKYLTFIIFAVFILGFFGSMGTLTSGYHFTDDHEMLNIESTLKSKSYLETVKLTLINDMQVRLRPLYYIHRVTEIKIFGNDSFHLSLYTSLLAIFTLTFLYLGARRLKFTITESVIFSLLIIIGIQMAIWWRLGPAETLGTFILSATFLYMAKCLEPHKFTQNTIIFVAFLSLASLTKESFVVIIPAFLLFKVWNEKNNYNLTMSASIIQNYWLAIPLLLMLIELWIIKFVIGTNGIGYAGTSSSLHEFIIGLKNIFLNGESLLYWTYLLGAVIIIFCISFFMENRKEKIKSFTNTALILLPYIFFAILIILPGIFLYAKSGMYEHYLLPTIFGYSFLVVALLHYMNSIFYRIVVIGLILIFLSYSFSLAKTTAKEFTIEGQNTNQALNAIRANADDQSVILLVADPVSRYEVSASTKRYLAYYGYDSLFADSMTMQPKNDFEQGLIESWRSGWFLNQQFEDMSSEPDIIMIMDLIDAEDYFSKRSLEFTDYNQIVGNENPYSVFVSH